MIEGYDYKPEAGDFIYGRPAKGSLFEARIVQVFKIKESYSTEPSYIACGYDEEGHSYLERLSTCLDNTEVEFIVRPTRMDTIKTCVEHVTHLNTCCYTYANKLAEAKKSSLSTVLYNKAAEPQEMTLAQIEKELGHPVKVIKG